MWKDSEHGVLLNRAKQNPTSENLDDASNYYYGLLCQLSLRREQHREIIDNTIAILEELANHENCTVAKKLIAEAKATRKYRYSIRQIAAMLESARNQPNIDTKLANEFYEYIGVPCGYIYYSNQHEKIATELLSIYETNKEKLADIYLLILAAFLRTSDVERDKRRLFAGDLYREIIDRNSPWTAEAFYQRGDMLEGSGNEAFRLSRYCAGYNRALANKQQVLVKKCLEQINRLSVRINWEHLERNYDHLRVNVLKLCIMGLIDDRKHPSGEPIPRDEQSIRFLEVLFNGVDKARHIQIISQLCEEYFIEIVNQQHSAEQIQLLEKFINNHFSRLAQIYGDVAELSIIYTRTMNQLAYLQRCNFTLGNNTKIYKSVDEETPLQLLMSQPLINLLQVLDLLHQGEAKNTKNREGDTLLHIAAKNKWPDAAIELLLDAGLDSNVRDQDGNTILHILAAQRRQELIATLIKKYHANPTILDKNRQTAEQVLAHASHWWTRITNSLGFESDSPAPAAPSSEKETQVKQEKTVTPLPSFGSYPDISAMKAAAQAQYAAAKQDENPYAKLPGFFGYVGGFLDKLDNTFKSSTVPLQNAGGGMLVGRNSLPDQTPPDPHRLAPSQLKPSESVEESEEEIQQRKADTERLAKLEQQSDAQRLAKEVMRVAQQNDSEQATQPSEDNTSQKVRAAPSLF